MKNKPILITGIHRSGSTWIGKILSVSKELQYIHEPFNKAKYRTSPIDHWFQYVNSETSNIEQESIKNYLMSFTNFSGSRLFKALCNVKFKWQIKQALLYELNCFLCRPLFKDPIAVMSAEWLYKELDTQVLVSIRHPAAFVASIKIANWHFDFNNFLEQQALMDDHLDEFKIEIEKELSKKDLITTGILLWNCIYSYVNKLQKTYYNNSDWIFIKHEDLSKDPIAKYQEIFTQFGLKFNQEVKDEILKTTTSKNKGDFSRDAKKNIYTWKERLTDSEIALIKKETKKIWLNFYTDQDW
ncbi:sulfotransferase [Hanstruepera ponticola]|uniref:sulfotransferase n=1 Tax=Hanstruepera ponticola TaxID=2042995 RepID=UPI00177DADD5|nr:sulfotransferase [Hanstruepera ponticola]